MSTVLDESPQVCHPICCIRRHSSDTSTDKVANTRRTGQTSSPGRSGRSSCFSPHHPPAANHCARPSSAPISFSSETRSSSLSLSQHRRRCRLDRNNLALLACTSAHVRWARPQHINRPFGVFQLASDLSSDRERPPPSPLVKHRTPRAARQPCRHQQATKTTQSSI
jgi:hypothetical protein